MILGSPKWKTTERECASEQHSSHPPSSVPIFPTGYLLRMQA